MVFEERTQMVNALSSAFACPEHSIAKPTIEGRLLLYSRVVWQINLIDANQWTKLRRLTDRQVAVKYSKMWLWFCSGKDYHHLVKIGKHSLCHGSLRISIGIFAQKLALTR